eukprot:g11028.t1
MRMTYVSLASDSASVATAPVSSRARRAARKWKGLTLTATWQHWTLVHEQSCGSDPPGEECATLPDVVTVNGKPTVSGRDCLTDSECLRPDNSLGRCLCKQWWEGAGTAGYCELSELQVWKPAFKCLDEHSWVIKGSEDGWNRNQAAIVACHHDWSEERCAAEIGLEEVLATVRRDSAALSSDPTEIKSCATELLETWDFNGLHRGAHALLCLPLLVQLL